MAIAAVTATSAILQIYTLYYYELYEGRKCDFSTVSYFSTTRSFMTEDIRRRRLFMHIVFRESTFFVPDIIHKNVIRPDTT